MSFLKQPFKNKCHAIEKKINSFQNDILKFVTTYSSVEKSADSFHEKLSILIIPRILQ